MKNIEQLAPKEIRNLIRKRNWDKPTAGLAMGYAQANLVILPQKYAFDFLLFCQRNPKPCPLLEVLEPGEFRTKFLSLDADIRTDIPRYHIYRKGKLQKAVQEIKSFWKPDFVSFLLGCSFSFEEALLRANIPVRHIEENKNVPMFTMRPIPSDQVTRAVQITSRYASVHGAPIHIGDPSAIGIEDLKKPDFGDPVTIKKGEVPVFWACGVTPQAVVMKTKPDLCMTHAPGHMFISDLLNEELAIL
jgi:uncharacterized protein YcsI (UPF0317 family)